LRRDTTKTCGGDFLLDFLADDGIWFEATGVEY
jgi:hypothetical protein